MSQKRSSKKIPIKPAETKLVSILTSISPRPKITQTYVESTCDHLLSFENELRALNTSGEPAVKTDILKRMICSLTTQLIIDIIAADQTQLLDILVCKDCCETQEVVVVCGMFFTTEHLLKVVQNTQAISTEFRARLEDWKKEATLVNLPCIAQVAAVIEQQSQQASAEAELIQSLQSSLRVMSFDKVNELLLKLKK
jgi:hypothetical protein